MKEKNVRGQRGMKTVERRWSMLIFPVLPIPYSLPSNDVPTSEKLRGKAPPVALFYNKYIVSPGLNGNCGLQLPMMSLNSVEANCRLMMEYHISGCTDIRWTKTPVCRSYPGSCTSGVLHHSKLKKFPGMSCHRGGPSSISASAVR